MADDKEVLRQLSMHETREVEDGVRVRRVHEGWIYEYIDAVMTDMEGNQIFTISAAVFVPRNNYR